MNNCTMIGRLVKDPELKYTQSNMAVVTFTLAVDRPVKNKDGERPTDWIPCVAWDKTAEVLGKYGNKGDLIGIRGTLQTRSWETQDGQKRTAVELIVNELQLLSPKKKEEPKPEPKNEAP